MHAQSEYGKATGGLTTSGGSESDDGLLRGRDGALDGLCISMSRPCLVSAYSTAAGSNAGAVPGRSS